MSTQIATAVYLVGILALFALDRHTVKASSALWVPTVWLMIAASRAVSQWATAFGWGEPSTETASQRYIDGSPLDRNVLTMLMIVGAAILVKRRRVVGPVLRQNAAVVLFFLYCGVSVVWSDYPIVALKRWNKAVGDLVMVLVVLTEHDPIAATRRLLARAGFVLIPLSLLLIKYYSEIGRRYDSIDGVVMYTGVTDGKNMLGTTCLLLGIGAVWRLLSAARATAGRGRTSQLIAHATLLATVLWIFSVANAMTALLCFAIASTLMIVTTFRRVLRSPYLVHSLLGGILLLSFSILFLGVGEGVLHAIGRDATLTGRTDVWQAALALPVSRIFGAGFESFWLGSRLDAMWRTFWWHPNQAHNGYLEVFLNLGWVGLTLLMVVMITGYRTVVRVFRGDPDAGRLKLAYFVVGVVMNFTEGAFKMMSPAWIMFLLAVIALPQPTTALPVIRQDCAPRPSARQGKRAFRMVPTPAVPHYRPRVKWSGRATEDPAKHVRARSK